MHNLSCNQNRQSTQVHRYTVLFEPVPGGGYHVIVPALPEVVTFGENLDETRAMALDAIKCVLESLATDGLPAPANIKLHEDPVKEEIEVAVP
jgi:antitoxin HicB